MANPSTQVGLGKLPPGTVVDGWRVQQVLGRGGGGTVYAAEPLKPEGGGRFALKLASRPQDLRFQREVELMSRFVHPRVPRLHGHGWWVHSSGAAFPYLVMDRIDGVGLYEWASERAPSSRQVLRVMADVASALEALHRAGCVHRDIKGENVLVSPEGRGHLIDFGAGDFQGASTLTDEVLPPGTPYYRSPQALRFQWEHRRERAAHYEPGPADDVYALGVTGYIVVTGSAPMCQVDPVWEADPASGPRPPPLTPPSALATVSPKLEELILRMMSDEPSERGSTGEVAQALERNAGRSGAKEEAPTIASAQGTRPKGSSRPRRVLRAAGLAAALGCGVLAACLWWETRSGKQVPREMQQAGAVAMGDVGPLASATASPGKPSTGVGREMPKKPFPSQQLPPCPEGFSEVEIELTEGNKDTRSCWIKGDVSTSDCKLKGYEYKGGCYLPAPAPPPLQLPQSAKP